MYALFTITLSAYRLQFLVHVLRVHGSQLSDDHDTGFYRAGEGFATHG
jgi:hypothetical protein